MRFPYSWINRVGGLALRLGLAKRRLDGGRLLEAAVDATGLSDFGAEHFRDGLDALVEATHAIDCHFIGRATLERLIVRHLVNRLRLFDYAKRVDLDAVELRPPLIVMGLPRSGTTHLHRLLCVDPAHRMMPLWELLEPIPGPGRDRRRQKVRKEMDAVPKLLPELDKKHFTRADEPEECVVLLANSLISPMFWYTAPVYDYLDFWTRTEDRLAVYREYRLQLKVLQSLDPSLRLALKAPAHLGSLAELTSVLPEALIVQTHRDPVKSLHSLNSLQATLHHLVSDERDPLRLGRTQLDHYGSEMDRCLEALDRPETRVFHIGFADIVSRPVTTVRSIYEHFGLPWTHVTEGAVDDYVRGHPRHKHGVHRYGSAEFGIDDDDISSRFATYRQRFADRLAARR